MQLPVNLAQTGRWPIDAIQDRVVRMAGGTKLQSKAAVTIEPQSRGGVIVTTANPGWLMGGSAGHGRAGGFISLA